MDFITGLVKKTAGFVSRSTRTKTAKLLVLLILISATSLTVIVAQRQQTLKQRAWFFGLCLNSNADSDCACNEACTDGTCRSYYDTGYPGALVQSFCETTVAGNPDAGTKTGRECMSGAHIATDQAGHNGVFTDWVCDDSNSSYSSVCPGSAVAGYVMAVCSAKCGFTTLISWNPPSSTCVPINTVPTSTPTNYTCQSSGGQCIPMAPCNPGYDYFGTGGTLCASPNIVCCMPMTTAPTTAPIPTSAPYVPPTTAPIPTSAPYVPPVIIPTSYIPPTAVPTQVSSVILVSALNAQDISLTSETLSANLILYNLTTNNQVAGAPATQLFTKTSIPDRQYSVNITLTSLVQDKYFIIFRKDNMIAKSVFTVSGSGETITVPTTTLVFGDINNDNKIDIADYNIFRSCWKRAAVDSCAASDFDNSGGVIEQVDYNTWLRGFATWTKEGQGL